MAHQEEKKGDQISLKMGFLGPKKNKLRMKTKKMVKLFEEFKIWETIWKLEFDGLF